MADENTELAPEGTPSPEQQESQPPIGPAAPVEGTPEPATQETGTPETPEVLAQRKAYWQEKARQLSESARETQQRLREYEMRYGPMYSEPTATQPPQAAQPSMTPAPAQPAAVDPFDPNFLPVLEERMGNVLENKLLRIRQDEQLAARRANAGVELQKWCDTHKISEELQTEAGRQYANYFRLPNGQVAGTPEGFVWFVQQYITSKIGEDQTKAYSAQAIADAAAKAKAIPGVAQPAGGAAPPPASQQKKTWQDIEADKIAPPDPEPNFT